MSEHKDATKTKTEDGHGQVKELTPTGSTTPVRGSNVSPFSFIRRFAEEMDHLFEDFAMEGSRLLPGFLTQRREFFGQEPGIATMGWSPKVDVLEREGHFVVRADLPGLSKENIKVDLNDDHLTIRGERTQEKKEEREGRSYSECSYGSFYRSIPLPEGVDVSKATAEFRNGVLEITMPAPGLASHKTRQLEIKEAH